MAPRGNMTLVPGALGAQTNMHLSVEEAMKIGGRNGVIDTLLVLTDGLPKGGSTPGSLTDKAFTEARAQGVKVLFLLIGSFFQWPGFGLPSHWMDEPAIQINSFNDLAAVRGRVIDMVCNAALTTSSPKVQTAVVTNAPKVPPVVVFPPPPTASPTADPTPPPTPPPTADPTTWKPGPNETPVYNIKYTKKWSHCSNVGACIKGSKCALEAACNAAGKECTGFSFTTGAVVGNGCLKKCGNAEFGGFGKGTHDYYAKGGYTVCKAEETQLADIEEGVNAEATWGSRRRRDRRRRYWDRRRRTPSPMKMTYPPIAAMSCGKVDLALVIDASGSVNAQQWEKQMGFAQALVKNMGISSSSVNAGIVMFARTASTQIGLTSSAAALMPHLVNRNGVDTGATNMVAALDHADRMLKRGRRGVPKVMMMLTDGEPNRGGNPDANFAAMKAAGTSVMMVLIGPGISSRRAKNWGSMPPISISSFTALSSAFTTISKEFCSVAKEAVDCPAKDPDLVRVPQGNCSDPRDTSPYLHWQHLHRQGRGSPGARVGRAGRSGGGREARRRRG